MSGPDEQDDFIFRPQQHLDAKWLNPDLHDVLQSPEALCTLFNSLLQDREIYFEAGNGLLNASGITAKLGDSGKYYCGLRVSKDIFLVNALLKVLQNTNQGSHHNNLVQVSLT